jgi:hypothetical protein
VIQKLADRWDVVIAELPKAENQLAAKAMADAVPAAVIA